MRKSLLIFFVCVTISQTLIAQVINHSPLSTLGGFNNIQRVLYKDNIAYILDSYSIISLDVTEPTNPVLLDNLSLGDWTLALDIHDTIAFVSSGSDIAAVNISNPNSLRLINTYDTGNFSYALRVQDSCVYIANFSRFLVLGFDGENFSYLGQLPTVGLNKAVDVKGDYAYIGEDQQGFYLISIDDPYYPSPLSYVDTPGWCVDIKVSGDYAYIADASIVGVTGRASMQIVRIADIFDPVIVGSYISYGGNALRVFVVRNDYVILADGEAGIKLISVENPNNPTLLDSLPDIGYTNDITYTTGLLFGATRESLKIFSADLGTTTESDTIPPTITLVQPEPNIYTSCIDQEIILLLEDNDELDTNSIEIRIDGENYTLADPSLTFRHDTLYWIPSYGFPNGDTVEVSLISCADTSGNSADSLPYQFQFIIDLAPPVCISPQPAPDTSISNRQPLITIDIIDSLSGVDTANIRLYVDEVERTRFTFADNQLRFLPYSPFNQYDTVSTCIRGVRDMAMGCGVNVADDLCWTFYIEPTPLPRDTIPPQAHIIYPIPGTKTANPRQNAKFYINDNTLIDLYSIEVQANETFFAFPNSRLAIHNDTLIFTPLEDWLEGNNILQLTALTDTAGNSASDLPLEITMLSDFTPPEITDPIPVPDTVILPQESLLVSATIRDTLSGLEADSLELIINDEVIEDFSFDTVDGILSYYYRPGISDTVVYVCIANAADSTTENGPNIASDFRWRFYIAVGIDENNIPQALKFGKIYPNPFNTCLSIPYTNPKEEIATVKILTITGENILKRIVKLHRGRGTIKLELENKTPSGLLFIYIVTPSATFIRKGLFIK